MVYYKLQLEGGPNIPLTCSNVQLVLGSPPSGRKLVLDTHCIREDCVPSIIKIEDLMVEIKNATEFHRLFIIFVCATLSALTTCLESHHALWHALPESLTGDVNWRQFLLMKLCTSCMTIGRVGGFTLEAACCSYKFILAKTLHLVPTLLVIFTSQWDSLILSFINNSSMFVSLTFHQCKLTKQCLIVHTRMKIWSKND